MDIPRNIQRFLKASSSNLAPMQRLCRVLKGPGCYICGLCGRRYQNPNDAWKCLTSNGLKINSIPVIATKSNSQTYFCLLCGKTYASQIDTALCVIRDLQVSKFPRVLGNHLHNLFASLAEQAEKTKRDTLTSKQGTIGTKVPKKIPIFDSSKILLRSKPEAVPNLPSFENHPDTMNSSSEQDIIKAQEPTIEDLSEEPGSTGDPMDHEADVRQKPQEIEKPVLYRKPNQKPFARENAQYRCTVCNEKFFTKMEVETHFEEHPLVDEV